MLGHAESASRATLVRYLEASAWNVDTAACNVMDSAWFKSSHSADAAPASTSSASAAAAASAVQHIAISDDDEEGAFAAAAPKRKLPSSGGGANEGGKKARAASATGTLESFARAKSEDPDDDAPADFLRSSAPAPVLPLWDRKLLLILNVSATSLTRGDALKVGDAIEFRREPFDLDAWLSEQQAAAEESKAASDAAANARSIAAASADGGKKKPALARGKSKTAAAAAAAALVKKRAKRVLRFTKRGACASHLELGSVPAILSDLLAPLLDSGCVDLDGEILYLPAKLEPFDSITLSLSVFVLPALFMYRTPAGLDEASAGLGAHPFWRKQNAAAALAFNPVASFARLLKECDVRPLSSTEMEIDQAAEQATTAEATTDVEMIDDTKTEEHTAAAAGAASSSSADASASAAASSSATAPASAASAAGVEEADAAPDNSEGATVSKFQLNAIYSSATAVCASIPEADAPAGLRTTLRPYQRQALYWMMQRERGDASEGGRAGGNGDSSPSEASSQRKRHALWDEYAFADAEETRFYLNPFSNECSLVFPESTGSCLGGVLADEVNEREATCGCLPGLKGHSVIIVVSDTLLCACCFL